MIRTIKTLDAHVAGQPIRLIVEGMPRPSGATMAQKSEWLRRRADGHRRSVLCEPRGHGDLRGAMLTEPVSPEAHAGVLFLDADGCRPLSGHGLMGVATIALERGLLYPGETRGPHGTRLVLDTVAGPVTLRAAVESHSGSVRVDSVSFVNRPAFVHAAARPIALATRNVRVDIAFGGLFHAIVDTEAVGIPLTMARVPDLARLAVEICSGVNHQAHAHPTDPALSGLAGVVFTGPPQDPEAHLRSVSVTASGRTNRSPGGTSTSALMAVLDAMGMLPEDAPFVHEGLVGTLFRGRVRSRTLIGEAPAVITEIEGSAWVTGEHAFFLDDDDPLREGLAVMASR